MWPELDPAARHGLAGRLVATLAPHTEADDVALLLSFLAAFGNAVGPGPRALVGATEHPARLNVLLVGQTARARKGTDQAEVGKVLALADPGWFHERVMGGLASGEGLIAAVRDPAEDEDADGPVDKRLLCVEAEFARVLGVAAREGNTLSAVLRQAWDDGRLRTMTRRDPLRASGAHISIVGHITADELLRRLGDTEIANGFANRFLLALVRRSKLLPEGGQLDPAALDDLAADVAEALQAARELWAKAYEDFGDGAAGLAGALTARPEAQTLRLSVAYTLLDGAAVIEPAHIEAALAVWRYCEASATAIFGSMLGDPIVDRLLLALREAGAAGLDGTEQRDLFGRHASGGWLALARAAGGQGPHCHQQRGDWWPASPSIEGSDVTRRDRATAIRLRVWPLLDVGLYPIPVHPTSRRPLVAWGELDRLGYRPGVGEALEGTTPGGRRSRWVPLVFAWWERWPGAGAAVLTGLSRLLVVDVDPRHGGHHALARLVERRPLPATRAVRSRSGGLHLYYRVDRPVRSGTGLLGAGLDVKSRKGLVVCPPTPGYALAERRPIAPAPAWLLARCTPTGRRPRPVGAGAPPDSPAAAAALQRALTAIGEAPRGERHATTYREACRVFRITDADQVEAALVAAAHRTSEPSEWRDRERAVRDARAFIQGRR